MRANCSTCAHRATVRLPTLDTTRLECWRYPPGRDGYPETKPTNSCGEYQPEQAPAAAPDVASAGNPPRATRVIKSAPAKRGGKNGR